MSTAGYVRASSKSQDTAMQRAAIERAAAARGEQVERWYEDKRSGRSIARHELERLCQDARQGLFRKLYVFRLDRLARSGIRDTFEVVEQLGACGVDLATVADGFDLTGPAAEVVLAVMAWGAKMERLTMNERIAAARERLAAEGRPWGRPPRLSDAERAKVGELRRQGRSLRAIAVALKVPRATVARVLKAKGA